MEVHDAPATFRGQLQRGRGSAVRRALHEQDAADAVYQCVINDTRWDRQVDERDSYLAGLVRMLDLSLAPIERYLAGFDDKDSEGVELALQVLALLPFAGRSDAVAALRRYALEGRHWHVALDAIASAGSLRLPGLWDGLAKDVVASHGARGISEVAWCGSVLWTSWAHSQPVIRRILQEKEGPRPAARVDDRRLREGVEQSSVEALIGVAEVGGAERRLALEELGRRGERVVLDLAEDPRMRNAAGWIPGMARALGLLGTVALARARTWITGDATMSQLGVRVLAEHGDAGDTPELLAALRHAVAAEAWCLAEIPARGLGRLHAGEAVDDLASAWENTVHSRAREAFLEAIYGCAADRADSFTAEGLYDCEPEVQRFACSAAKDHGLLRSRLIELADDALMPEVHEAARARLAALAGGVRS